MYVEKVLMDDFRSFEHAEVSFAFPERTGHSDSNISNVTLLIGINGSGKTTILKSIALGVLSPIYRQLGYRPYMLIRRRLCDKKEAHETADIHVHITFPENEFEQTKKSNKWIKESNQVCLDRVGDEDTISQVVKALHWETSYVMLNSEASPACFMLGYGASRRAEYIENLSSQNARRYHHRFQRVAGLFEEFITLYPLAAWYPSLKSKARSREIRELMNGLLPERTQFTGECKDGEGLFLNDGVTLPFSALSDGYRSFIGLIADMLYHMHSVWPKGRLIDLAGVIMIDDIDVHLHPGWQRDVVPKLAKTFPKMQFIITSHSPLVVGSVHAANIRVVEENQIREYSEETEGKTADQILMSPYFGLASPRSARKTSQLKKIASKVAATHNPKEAVAFLKELTGKLNGRP